MQLELTEREFQQLSHLVGTMKDTLFAQKRECTFKTMYFSHELLTSIFDKLCDAEIARRQHLQTLPELLKGE